MPNDHGVRTIDHDPEGLQATCLRRYGVTITDPERTTAEVGTFERRESAERVADAIRKAIADARVEALDEVIDMAGRRIGGYVTLEDLHELKERDDE